jgi:hypothetical protein
MLACRIQNKISRFFARPHKAPLLIAGNQKSGTSAIAALLAEGCHLPYTIDVFYRYPRMEQQLLKKEVNLHRSIWRARHEFSKSVVKEPSFFLFQAGLSQEFPLAKWVHIIRDPRDNIRSILNRLQISGSLDKLTEEVNGVLNVSPDEWRLVLDGRLAGHARGHYIETLAARCQLAASAALEMEARTVIVRYEDFLLDKLIFLKELAGKLELEWRGGIEDRLEVPFQPKGDSSSEHAVFFGDNLERINRECAGMMQRYGYH